MKYGVRKPNIKKSIKARTTGKIKRQIKSAVNPLYGKKGMGIINDPKKAAYNSVYNRTTVSISNTVNSAVNMNSRNNARSSVSPNTKRYSPRTYSICGVILIVLSVMLMLVGFLLLFVSSVAGVIVILIGIIALTIGCLYRKISKEHRNDL